MDHFSWSARPGSKRRKKDVSLNGCTHVPEAITHNHLDDLIEVMARLRRHVVWLNLAIAIAAFVCVRGIGETPAPWKLDVDSAFRRLPLAVEQRWAAAVAFMVGDVVFISQHFACAFGSLASVHNWERVGAMIVCFARRLLWIPVMRYVDDMFSADR